MSRFVNLVVVLTASVVLGCGGQEEGQSGEADQAHAHHVTAEVSESADTVSGLRLDGTRRWVMDEHTRHMFVVMSERLEGRYLSALSADELKATGAVLRADVDSLIAGCTMTGPAHDQLHTYLAAYIPAVGALAESGNAAQAEKVSELLALYPKYFE